MTYPPHRFAIAPMMDWTDRHCRFFHRLLTSKALLYTEMVTAAAVLHGSRERLIGFDVFERPLALQLGGCDRDQLLGAAKIGADFGYDEINLNIGCPSSRVQKGRFGACLMAEPELVGACVDAMRSAVQVPVTVKCRIGIDDLDSDAALGSFVRTVTDAGAQRVIVHARKAWLQGLSPKQNRQIPPLDYGRVHRLKAAHPELTIVVNGGIASLDKAAAHLKAVDGVMIGRAAYQNPYLLASVDQRFFADNAGASSGAACSRADGSVAASRGAILEQLMPYVERHLAAGGRLGNVTRHILGIYAGRPRARAFRRHLSEHAHRPGAGIEVLREALALAEGRLLARWREIA